MSDLAHYNNAYYNFILSIKNLYQEGITCTLILLNNGSQKNIIALNKLF